MAKAQKIRCTFKANKPTGQFKSFFNYSHEIKIKGRQMGTINNESPHRVSMTVMKTEEDLAKPENNKNCPWKWVHFKAEFSTLDEAKEWVNEHIEVIMQKYTLYFFDAE